LKICDEIEYKKRINRIGCLNLEYSIIKLYNIMNSYEMIKDG